MIKIKPSNRNTNKHTADGLQLIEKSISKVGAIESISVTEEGTIISGHARKQSFDALGYTPIEINLKPNEYAVLVRNDIKDNTKEYFEAQILANTTSQKNINLDIEMIEVLEEDYDIDIVELGVKVEEVDFDYSNKNKEFNSNDFENQKYSIKLEFTEDDYNFVTGKIKQIGKTPEKIIYDALVSL